MKPVAKSDIQRALVNVTKSERATLTVPGDFADLEWPMLDFYGWRDPKFPQRGYLVREQGESLIAVAVHASGGGLAPGRKAMCTICRAGRSGDTVGTYICAGLDCSAQLRNPTNRVGRSRLDVDLDIDEVAAEMLVRLDAFLDAVRAN